MSVLLPVSISYRHAKYSWVTRGRGGGAYVWDELFLDVSQPERRQEVGFPSHGSRLGANEEARALQLSWLTAVRICGRRTCRTRGKRRDFRHCLRDPCPKLIHSQVDWKVPRWLMLD